MYELTLIALIVGTFVSTNVDNLAILVGWLLSGRVEQSHVAAGYALSVTTVIFISAVLGLSSQVIPVQWIGWLGIVPILLGIYALVSQFRGTADADVPEVSGNAAMFGVAATMIANSVDTVIVLAPLLVDTQDHIDPVLIGGFALMAVAWFVLASLLSRSAAKMEVIQRVAAWIAPLIMIAVGFYIISNTATDVL
jgi:cadmium resistance protein CadD (predicted permease)